jgi:hypothetical protein
MEAKRSPVFTVVGALTTLAMTLGLASACAAPPKAAEKPLLDAPARYAKDGVQFQYPGNWSLEEKTEREEGEEVRDISVGDKGSAGALLKVFEDAPAQSKLDQIIRDFSETLKDKVPDLVTLTDVTQQEVAAEVGGAPSRGVRKKFLFEMLFKRFSVSVDFHRIDGPTRSVFLVTVSNEKAEIVSPGFELIRRTLKVH